MESFGTPSRREFLQMALLGGAASLAFPPSSQAQGEPFRFGLTPVFLSNDLELLGHLRAYLEAKLGGPVELVSRRTYQEITALLVSGQLHAAWICGYPYVQFRDELELVATPSWRGAPLYRSYLITSTGRNVGWEALRGDIHAFSDPDSNSGFLVTAALLAENRLRPDQFFSHHFFTYGHRNVIRAVASGLARSGSVDGYVWDVMRHIEPDLVGRTQIVRESELLGFPPVASARSLTSDARIAIFREALLSMQRDPAGRMVLEMLRLDGFVATEASHFDTIAAKVAAVGQMG
jgi:phosphonate transport system substrate-binding protein